MLCSICPPKAASAKPVCLLTQSWHQLSRVGKCSRVHVTLFRLLNVYSCHIRGCRQLWQIVTDPLPSCTAHNLIPLAAFAYLSWSLFMRQVLPISSAKCADVTLRQPKTVCCCGCCCGCCCFQALHDHWKFSLKQDLGCCAA